MSFFPILEQTVSGYRHVSGAHDLPTASVEAPAADYNFSDTVTYPTGALALHRTVIWQQQTVAFDAASTIAEAATLYIEGPVLAGANATITDTFALWVDSGFSRFDGAIHGADGTLALPEYSFLGNTGSGMFRDGLKVGFSGNGSRLMILDPSVGSGQVVLIGSGTAAAPAMVQSAVFTSGCFWPGADSFALAAGGEEALRVDKSVVARDTRMLVFDVDNATLERVSVGIADSGGVGFKLLRIVN